MKKSGLISVIVQHPTTEEGRQELARRIAGVHADFVTDAICRLQCPAAQKLALLNAVIASVRQANKQG